MGMDVLTTWPWVLLLLTLLVNSCLCSTSLASNERKGDSNSESQDLSWTAIVNISYTDPQTQRRVSDKSEMGMYGANSLRHSVVGLVVHVRDLNNSTMGCSVHVNKVPPNTKWIALVQRGDCKFNDKIRHALKLRNATAVVIYNSEQHKIEEDDMIPVMSHEVDDVVAIAISHDDGQRIALLVDNGTKVMMNISEGNQKDAASLHEQFNKTSVLFVSISFIVLMVVSLAWLIFYYVQRFRYVHAKERLSRRLAGAAKKAIHKIPVRTMKTGDKETLPDAQQCAVCIENFLVSEVVRELPCKHLFHKSCVDPWLLDQRSCPMCKMDILKAYGLQVPGATVRDSTEDHIEITSTQSPDDDSIDPVRSIHMVHVESGVLFHHRQESLGSPSTDSSVQIDMQRRRNMSGTSTASHVSLKSNDSVTELQSLIHVKATGCGEQTPAEDNAGRSSDLSEI